MLYTDTSSQMRTRIIYAIYYYNVRPIIEFHNIILLLLLYYYVRVCLGIIRNANRQLNEII